MADRERIEVGKITGIFGVKGWVKVFSYTEPRENILNYSPWLLSKGDKTREVQLLEGKRQGKTIVAHLQDVDDRDTAAELCGWDVTVAYGQLPETREGEYYWTELVGLQVVTLDGVDLGRVDYLIATGANDVLVVKGDRERLLPFLQGQTIVSIDLQHGRMIVDWDPEF